MSMGTKAKDALFHPAAPYVFLGVMVVFFGYGYLKNKAFKETYGCGCGR